MADVEREVILEMASKAMTGSRSPLPPPLPTSSSPSSLSGLSSPLSKSPPNNFHGNKKHNKTNSPDSQNGFRLSPQCAKMANVFEMRLKTDQCNSTDSPVRNRIVSPSTNDKLEKSKKQEQSNGNQSKTWFDFLHFGHKKSPPQASSTDHLEKSKNSKPTSSQNKLAERSPCQKEKEIPSKSELDKCSELVIQKSSSLSSPNSQNVSPNNKDLTNQKNNPPILLPGPAYSADSQNLSASGHNHIKVEDGSTVLDNFTQQQHQNFQEQIRRYRKLKEKGKMVDQSNSKDQVIDKEKSQKTRQHKHKDKTNPNSKTISELNQCANCQMKARKLSLQDASKSDAPNSSNQQAPPKRNKNRQHRQTNGETSSNNSNNNQRAETSVTTQGNSNWTLSKEGMYVTFTSVKPGDPMVVETSRNSQTMVSEPQSLGNKDDKKADGIDAKPKNGKLKQSPKGNHAIPQDKTAASGASVCPKHHSEKSEKNTGNLSKSSENTISSACSKSVQNGKGSQINHVSDSLVNIINSPYYNINGLNGLTFSGSPLCYGGKNATHKNSTVTPEISSITNRPAMNGTNVPECVRRRNGGEYNNLSLDLQFNSQHSDPVQKPYTKSVPMHCGNILESPPHNEELQKHGLDGTFNSFINSRKNGEVHEDKSHLMKNSSHALSHFEPETNNSKLPSSFTVNVKAQRKESDLSNMYLEHDDEKKTDMKRLSPVDGEQNWQELLTASHDYFDSKYRLCFDEDDQDDCNSFPSHSFERSLEEEDQMDVSLSQTGNNDNSAYVAFVSCPNMPPLIQQRSRDALSKTVPFSANCARPPNGTLPHLAMFNPSPCTSASKSNPSASNSLNGKEESRKLLVRQALGASKLVTDKDIGAPIFPTTTQFSNVTNSTTDTHTNMNTAIKNKTCVSSESDHIIVSSISVSNGIKADISPTTANQIYLPVSVANGSHISISKLTNQISTSLSVANGNKESSVTKNIDYSKSLSKDLAFSSIPETSISTSNGLVSPLRDSSSNILTHNHNTLLNGQLNAPAENLNRPNSLPVSRSESSSCSAPKSLLKIFPSTLSAPGPPIPAKQFPNRDNCRYLNSSIGLGEDNAIHPTFDKRKDKSKPPPLYHSSMPSSSHLSPLADHLSFDNSTKQFSLFNSGPSSSPSFETEKRSQSKSNSAQNPKADDKAKCYPKNGHRPTSEPSASKPVFSVLPFGEYKMDDPQSHGPKSFAQCIAENKIKPQNLICGNSIPAKDHKNAHIQRREGKNSMYPNETSRYSSCSSHSTNEIQILKWPEGKDPSSKPDCKESLRVLSSHDDKNEFEGIKKCGNTMQVRYTPKSGFRKNRLVDKTSVSQSAPSSSGVNSTIPSIMVSNGFVSGVEKSVCQSNFTNSDSRNSSQSEPPRYANETMLNSSAAAGPDLLRVTVIQSGSSQQTSSRQTPAVPSQVNSPPKKQSFLAKLAHSPLSFLHRDSKNSTESK